MYNLTCDIAEAMGGLDARWLRKCPFATKSCFWSEATLDEESKMQIPAPLTR